MGRAGAICSRAFMPLGAARSGAEAGTMNDHALRVLEFDRFLEQLSRHACSEPGRIRLLGLRPRARIEEVAEDRALNGDWLRVRREGAKPPPVAFESPEAALVRAAPEHAVLDPEGFMVVRQLLEAVATARRFGDSAACAEAGSLRALTGAMHPCADLMDAIARTFDDEAGHVSSRASPKLSEVRTQITRREKAIAARLERMLLDTSLAEVFQDNFVTVRHGRFVLPVRRELRSRLDGIVLDQSGSGGTLFMEPREVVESGNELECLRLDEEREVRRILQALTDGVRANLEALRANSEALCAYDAGYAVSAWALAYDCLMPEVGERPRWIGARHPLLQHRLAEVGRLSELVPLDLDPPPGKNVVAITGSNTGGKTVALKTIGLLTLLAQAGLPIPADAGTRVRFFGEVVADIGDEQSIEQSLSTFSAHLEHVVETLAAARGSEALVLLDELGAGTDPVEGGALGCAILDALSRTNGLTVATTHLGVVKRFVHAHPGMENAAMLFNVETLRPEYRLFMGRAGASYAMTIAERCGLPADVLTTARALLSEGEARLERMLSDLDRKHMALDREREAAAREKAAAEEAKGRADVERQRVVTERKELRGARKRALHEAQGEALSLVANARRDVEQALTQARTADRRRGGELRRELERKQESLARGLEETRPRASAPLRAEEYAVGRRVWVTPVRDHGIVAAVEGGGERVTVVVGGLRFGVRRLDLERARSDAPAPSRPAVEVHAPGTARTAAKELNLVGLRVEEALPPLQRFLDAAILAGLSEVRVAHGYGSGALRKAVHAHLDSVGLTRYRLGKDGDEPGGSGVTVVSVG
jgi:DNA mismatch repair protein MutS2